MAQDESTISSKLSWLFENVLHPSGREYKYTEIEELTEQAGRKVAASYVGKLRRGEQENPAWDVVRVLAKVFGAPISFFFEKLSDEEMQNIKIANAIQESGV